MAKRQEILWVLDILKWMCRKHSSLGFTMRAHLKEKKEHTSGRCGNSVALSLSRRWKPSQWAETHPTHKSQQWQEIFAGRFGKAI